MPNNRSVKTRKTGGVRKKQNTRKIKKRAELEKKEHEYRHILGKLNICIKEAEMTHHKKDITNYINQALILIYANLRPQEINSKSKQIKSVKVLRRDWKRIHAHIIIQAKDVAYGFRESIRLYNKNLSEYGIKYILICYKHLYDNLLNKSYIFEPNSTMAPDDSELRRSLDRLGFGEIGLIECKVLITKEDLYRNYMQKTLEYHMDSPDAMKEQEKYKIMRQRVKKALITIDLYMDYFMEQTV